MKGGKSPLGYTIVEVMIVLAVSGLMFLIAANFINGKQQKTTFTSGVNETASRIQDVIEQVTDGEYSDVPFSCSAGGGAALSISVSSDPGKIQGTNPDCVFIGKLLHFSVGGDASAYEVFSLAAARSSTDLGPDVTPVRGGGIDLTIQQIVPQYLEISPTGVTVAGKPGHYYGFGFTQSQGTAGDSPGTYASGAQTIGLVYSPGLMTKTAGTSAAASSITGNVAAAKAASFCLTDGDRYAEISMGGTGTGSQLDVRVKIKGSTPC
ncbi:MAG TPA: prepilin-type N-terminal cleavage/methylation domain-containing protein [Candidatus Saccharimonadales bacterium]|nr:prepilin-type N-terminal cleavage/methylation domain-containing protein [Candidatus Saccharimonadales bacterium]